MPLPPAPRSVLQAAGSTPSLPAISPILLLAPHTGGEWGSSTQVKMPWRPLISSCGVFWRHETLFCVLFLSVVNEQPLLSASSQQVLGLTEQTNELPLSGLWCSFVPLKQSTERALVGALRATWIWFIFCFAFLDQWPLLLCWTPEACVFRI